MPDIIVDSRCLDGRDAVRTTSREFRTLDVGLVGDVVGSGRIDWLVASFRGNRVSMQTMKAMVIDGFGGPDQLRPLTMPVPVVADGEVLVRLEVVGVGEWDPFEREGGYAEMLGTTPEFPYVLGSEGAGEVAAAGRGVERLVVGDLVYAVGFLNPRGGFYAEQVVIAEDLVSRVPDGLTAAEAGAWVALEPQRCAGSMTSCTSSRGRRCWCSGPAAGSVISLCNLLAGWAGEFWPWRQATMASSWPAGSMPTRWSTDDATTCRRRRNGSLAGASMQRC